MMKTHWNFSTGLSILMTSSVLTLAMLPSVVLAQNYAEGPEPQKIYSPYVERTQSDANFAEGVYFGDTHVHTSYSADAGMLGTTLDPEDAYRFALGEEVLSNTGQRVRLIRPLDFTVVGDHAENLGLAPMIDESNPDLLTHEKVYDVAVSDGRTIDSDGRCRTPVGNTVDEASASYLNNIGDAELRATWTDPDFDPELPAVYYTRVLEIPTPTWQAHDSKFYGITMPEEVPLSHQERAYTSPIWYTP